jgi:metal-sulfur cluster biosynthetic enzyme
MIGAAPVSPDAVMDRLRQVMDPELGIDIVSLGLVYAVQVDGDEVTVVMTLTTRGCPMQGPILDGVHRVLGDLPGTTHARVDLVWDPPWTPDRIHQ